MSGNGSSLHWKGLFYRGLSLSNKKEPRDYGEYTIYSENVIGNETEK